MAGYTIVKQYCISDSPIMVCHFHRTLNTGIASVVWQQQKNTAYIQKFNNMHMIHKTLPTYEYDYTENFDTQFTSFQKSFHATHISLTLEMDLTPIGMKTYLNKTN